jgi:hypothetical protein
MLYSVVTTINEPTSQMVRLSEVHQSHKLGDIIIIGDLKGPKSYDLLQTKLINIEHQDRLYRNISQLIPKNHYARKNIGYLIAMNMHASCIYETDDDNRPSNLWKPRSLVVEKCKRLDHAEKWTNIYKYFTTEKIWPRGLPLDRINTDEPKSTTNREKIYAPIQQGLVDNSPDVDAIWRLTENRIFYFDPERRDSICIPKGIWCPFNTQSTWWWPDAFALMYIPSFCSFRMCDIWKSFIAQRCLWELNYELIFHPSEVIQDRNWHDLNKDFLDEIPGYINNQRIIDILEKITLKPGAENVLHNLYACYEALVENNILPSKEMSIVEEWCKEISQLRN